MMEYDDLLEELKRQEDELQFTSFTNDTALEVGLALLREARRRGKPHNHQTHPTHQQLFHFAMEGTSLDNGEWVKRKNNVVYRFGHSSYFVGISLKSKGQTMEEKYLISSHEYAAHGGAFPIIIQNVGVVGTITVSGLPQKEDHEMVVTVLERYLAGDSI